MPQMAPMNWVTLLIYSIIMLLILNTMMYFVVQQMPQSSKKLNSLKINWKW
uniref:ATP synthase complex subunit 8 n=1 Tax=Rhadinosa nigrocyanea TaxID=2093842 RepID=A0A343UQA2_9CUCU|nr:ATP synthase F0 subunit 8 [Rhadinosa nigrocyanea]AVF96877.1 ATP synthase F0 subunit 8 [Rhadinosa nigrocyanea]